MFLTGFLLSLVLKLSQYLHLQVQLYDVSRPFLYPKCRFCCVLSFRETGCCMGRLLSPILILDPESQCPDGNAIGETMLDPNFLLNRVDEATPLY